MESSIQEAFFKTFNISKKKNIDLRIKEELETFWITKEYRDEVETPERDFSLGGYYELLYQCDQWYGAVLYKLVYKETKVYLERVYRGEGDSLTEALLALFIEAEKIIDENEKGYIKSIFEEE